MNKAEILELPRPCIGGSAHLHFDMFSFHHYFQIVLATTLKYQDTRQGFGIHERLKYLLSAELVLPPGRLP